MTIDRTERTEIENKMKKEFLFYIKDIFILDTPFSIRLEHCLSFLEQFSKDYYRCLFLNGNLHELCQSINEKYGFTFTTYEILTIDPMIVLRKTIKEYLIAFKNNA